MASTIRVNPMRRRSSGTFVMLEKPPTTAIFPHPFVGSAMPELPSGGGFGLRLRRLDHHGLALLLLDLLGGLLAERVRDDRELFGQLAFCEDLDANLATLHEPSISQRLLVHGGSVGKPLELPEVHDHGLDRKGNAKAALRHAALNRGLPALKMELVKVTGAPRLLTLHSLTAGLADAGARATPETANRMARA